MYKLVANGNSFYSLFVPMTATPKDDYLDIAICVWGDNIVGKQCFTERFIKKEFSPRKDTLTTISSFYCRTVVSSVTIDLDIHVIPTNITKDDTELLEILKKTVANIFCYSTRITNSLQSIEEKWIPLAALLKERVPSSFVCLKSDLPLSEEDKDIITKANQIAIKNNCFHYQCSAKANENVIEVFNSTITAAMSRRVGEVTRNKEFPKMPEIQTNERIIITKLFAPLRCSICSEGIEYSEHYNQCFAGECKNLKSVMCDSCISNNLHEHIHYRELYQKGRTVKLQGDNFTQTLTNVFNAYKVRPIFGWSTRHLRDDKNGEHKYIITHDGKLQWITYDEFYRRSLLIGHGLMEFCNVEQGDFVGTCGRNQLEWYLSNISCIFKNIRGIAIHTTYSIDDLHHLITNARLRGVFCSKEQIEQFMNLLIKYPKCISFIISLDPITQEELDNLRKQYNLDSSIKLSTIDEIEKIGKNLPPLDVSEIRNVHEKSIFILQYTSGSTGRPKGVVVSHKNFNHDILPRKSAVERSFTISYEPLAHSSYDNDIKHLCGGWQTILYEDKMGDQFFEDL